MTIHSICIAIFVIFHSFFKLRWALLWQTLRGWFDDVVWLIIVWILRWSFIWVLYFYLWRCRPATFVYNFILKWLAHIMFIFWRLRWSQLLGEIIFLIGTNFLDFAWLIGMDIRLSDTIPFRFQFRVHWFILLIYLEFNYNLLCLKWSFFF